MPPVRRLPGRLGRPRTPEPHSDVWQRGTAIAAIISVVLVGVGLWVTNDFNRDQLAQQQESSREQQELALKGQRADRFVRAIDQLGQEGADNLGVRLGAIYAMEVLMKDFAEDENMVIEVLCAFIRTHAPWRKSDKVIPTATPDVRAALTVLGRRPDPDRHAELDLSDTSLGLTYFNLPRASFSRADLSESNFSKATMPGADLRGTYLSDAFLDEVDLSGANLEGASLYSTSLRGADLSAANLRNVDFDDADLTGADLTGADLSFTPPAQPSNRLAVTSAQLECAKLDAGTVLPSGVDRPPAEAWTAPACEV